MPNLKFPKNFLWGAAVSSYQVEGGIENCDWSKNFPAGRACDYYNQYEKYFDLAKELNQNIHRFSLEWSRIEPEEGKFNRKEIEHYRKILLALRARNIKAMVTLWHFTSPIWFAEKGGWQNRRSAEYFENYARFIVKELGDLVDFWVTINEPMIYLSQAYIIGRFPPRKKNILLALIVFRNFLSAHKKAYQAIHHLDANAKVGLARNYSFVESYNKNSFLNRAAANIFNFIRNRLFLVFVEDKQDFLGVNYYFHDRVKIVSKFPFFKIENKNKKVSDLGWEIFPKGIYEALKNLQEYNLPIYITENGLADKKDKNRAEFIREHLKYVHKAISEGVNVKGYLHWSLLDNFEWADGFKPRFGLVEMDYEKMEVKIRESAREYAEICGKNNI
ncbi:MAG: glycoside hydrolase family 1 protein [Patescibacteria group bacterium]|nr:glycoside hydrolase family 1 protein [Patescibacteria group bacterium]